jgi:hypothetical protein
MLQPVGFFHELYIFFVIDIKYFLFTNVKLYAPFEQTSDMSLIKRGAIKKIMINMKITFLN